MRFFRSIFITFTVWNLTALLNALLMGTVLSILSNEFRQWSFTFGFAIVFTLIFSIPGIFIFWVVLTIKWHDDDLFRSLLKVGFIVSALSSLILYNLPFGLTNHEMFLLSLCIVIAAIASIMMHRSTIISINNNKQIESHA